MSWVNGRVGLVDYFTTSFQSWATSGIGHNQLSPHSPQLKELLKLAVFPACQIVFCFTVFCGRNLSHSPFKGHHGKSLGYFQFCCDLYLQSKSWLGYLYWQWLKYFIPLIPVQPYNPV